MSVISLKKSKFTNIPVTSSEGDTINTISHQQKNYWQVYSIRYIENSYKPSLAVNIDIYKY